MDGSAGTPPLRDRLLAEQTTLDALLDSVIASLAEPSAPSQAFAVWPNFVRGLVAQLDAEDELVSAMPYERGARVLVQEHGYIRIRLRELDGALRRGDLRRGTLETFREILRAHARNDDRLLYRWAEDALAGERRKGVLDEVTKRVQVLRHYGMLAGIELAGA